MPLDLSKISLLFWLQDVFQPNGGDTVPDSFDSNDIAGRIALKWSGVVVDQGLRQAHQHGQQKVICLPHGIWRHLRCGSDCETPLPQLGQPSKAPLYLEYCLWVVGCSWLWQRHNLELDLVPGNKVPVKRYTCKEDYGVYEFERKATSICGGHLIELRHRNEMHAPHAEYLDLPRNAKSFLLQKWSEVRASIGARLRINEGQVVISGSQRQARWKFFL